MFSRKIFFLLATFVVVTTQSNLTFFPFGSGAGDLELPPGDQSSSNETQISDFPFFNQVKKSLWVNVKGAISFGNATSLFRTFDSTCNASREFQMIAPYWADISTTILNDSHVYYRLSVQPNSTDFTMVKQEVLENFPNLISIDLKWVLVATWENVTMLCLEAPCDNRTNTFQTVLTTDGVQSYVLFLYQQLTWDIRPGVSGTTSAQASFQADQVNRYTLPGSCTPSVVNLTQFSNTNIPGKWIFRVDNTKIQSPGCSSDFDGTLLVTPGQIDWMGHRKLTLNGPCYSPGDNITCRYYDTNSGVNNILEIPAMVDGSDSSTKFICGTPFFYTIGRIQVDLVFYNTSNIVYRQYTGYITIIPPKINGNGLTHNTQTVLNGITVMFNWTVENFANSTGENVVPKISIWLLRWGLNGQTNNTYILNGTSLFSGLPTENGTTGGYIIVNTGDLCQISANNLLSRLVFVAINADYTSIDQLEYIDYFAYESGDQVEKLLTNICPASTRAQMCTDWLNISGSVSNLPTCPPTYSMSTFDPNWIPDPSCSVQNTACTYNLGAKQCIVFAAPNRQGNSQQCCYKNESIFLDAYGGGRSQFYHPNVQAGMKHFAYDSLGYLTCCDGQNIMLCEKFLNLRPTSTTDNNAPGISASYGEPHFVTFDGLKYTHNDIREYWMLKNNVNQSVAMQARFTELIITRETGVSGITAFVMKSDNSPKIQVQQSDIRTADIYIDNVYLDNTYETDQQIDFSGVHVKITQQLANIIVSFAEGITFTITPFRNAFGVETLLSNDFRNKTIGLLGVYNGDPNDDLTLPNGTVLPPNTTGLPLFYALQAWSITEQESLFYYTDGDSWSNRNPENDYVPEVNPTYTDTDQMNRTCLGDPFCMFDYAITGDSGFANETRDLGIKLEDTKMGLQLAPNVSLCPVLRKIDNGYVDLVTYFPPTNATYGCFDGYVLDGNIYRFCDINYNFTWNGTEPSCKPLVPLSTSTVSTISGSNTCVDTCISQCMSSSIFTTTTGTNTPGTGPTTTTIQGSDPTTTTVSNSAGFSQISALLTLFILWAIY